MLADCYKCKRVIGEISGVGYAYYYIAGHADMGIKGFCDTCCVSSEFEDDGWRKRIVLGSENLERELANVRNSGT